MTKTLNTKICLRTDTTANWDANSGFVLLKGEIGIEILANGKTKIKIGDSVTPWAELDYFNDTSIELNSSGAGNVISNISYNLQDNKLMATKNITALTMQSSSVDTETELSNIKFVAGLDPVSTNGEVIQTQYRNLVGSETVLVTPDASGNIKISGSYLKTKSCDQNVVLVWITTDKDSSYPTPQELADGNAFTIKTTGATTITQENSDSSPSNQVITISSFDTGANSIVTVGDGEAVSSASYDPESRQLTLSKNFTQTPVTVEDDLTIQGIVTEVSATANSHKIQTTKSITYTTQQPNKFSSNTQIPTAKAVYDAISASLAAIDTLRYKGTVGVDGSAGTNLPTENVKVGDTYKIKSAGVYAGITASLGDLFIALTTAPTWDYIQSGDDGNVYHSDTLIQDQLIVGNYGDDVKVLPAGTEGQVLKMKEGVPTWGTDKGIDSVDVIGDGDAVTTASYDSASKKLSLSKGYAETELTKSDSDGNSLEVTLDFELQGTKNHIITRKKATVTAGDDIAVNASQGNITIATSYTKDNLATKLNNDADVLIINGGLASGEWN